MRVAKCCIMSSKHMQWMWIWLWHQSWINFLYMLFLLFSVKSVFFLICLLRMHWDVLRKNQIRNLFWDCMSVFMQLHRQEYFWLGERFVTLSQGTILMLTSKIGVFKVLIIFLQKMWEIIVPAYLSKTVYSAMTFKIWNFKLSICQEQKLPFLAHSALRHFLMCDVIFS